MKVSNKLSALRKQGSRDNEPQSPEEPGRETTEKPPARIGWQAFLLVQYSCVRAIAIG